MIAVNVGIWKVSGGEAMGLGGGALGESEDVEMGDVEIGILRLLV